MRRFIVIFLLLLLPVQVLAQSLEDLRTPHHHVSLADADAVSTSADADVKHSRSSPDAPNLQQAGHADISDSRSEEHTSELQSLMRISYAVFGLKKKKTIEQTSISASK